MFEIQSKQQTVHSVLEFYLKENGDVSLLVKLNIPLARSVFCPQSLGLLQINTRQDYYFKFI